MTFKDLFGDITDHRVHNTTKGDAMFAALRKLFRDQNGATAIEYALVASLVSVVAFSFIMSIGTSVSASFESVASAL
jgi:pilus assembly protein Flp/PilA